MEGVLPRENIFESALTMIGQLAVFFSHQNLHNDWLEHFFRMPFYAHQKVIFCTRHC